MVILSNILATLEYKVFKDFERTSFISGRKLKKHFSRLGNGTQDFILNISIFDHKTNDAVGNRLNLQVHLVLKDIQSRIDLYHPNFALNDIISTGGFSPDVIP